MAFDHQRLEVGAGVVEGGGVTSTSGAHDHDVAYVHSVTTLLRFGATDFASSLPMERRASPPGHPNADRRDARLSTGTTGISLCSQIAWLQSRRPDEPVPEVPVCARPERRD